MRERVVAGRGARRRDRRRRDRRRRQRHVQHLDDGRARRRRGRASRSRSTATGRSRRRRARPTCSTRSASGSTTTPRRRGAPLRELGFAFLFAPAFHPAMRTPGPTRREIGVRTAFNLLGPLTNPAGTTRGAARRRRRRRPRRGSPRSPRRLGTERTFVIHGDGRRRAAARRHGRPVRRRPRTGSSGTTIPASRLGLAVATPTAELAGGTADENARMVEAVLARRARRAARRRRCSTPAAALLVAGARRARWRRGSTGRR